MEEEATWARQTLHVVLRDVLCIVDTNLFWSWQVVIAKVTRRMAVPVIISVVEDTIRKKFLSRPHMVTNGTNDEQIYSDCGQ